MILTLFLFTSVWEMKGQETFQMTYRLIEDNFHYEIYEGDIRTGPYELFMSIDENRLPVSEGHPDDTKIVDFHVDLVNDLIYLLQNHGDFYVYNLLTDALTHITDLTPENTSRFWNNKNQFTWFREESKEAFYMGGLTYGRYNLDVDEFNTLWQPPSFGQAFTEYYRTRTSMSVVEHHSQLIYTTNNVNGENRLGMINKSNPDNPEILYEYNLTNIWKKPMISLRDECDSARLYIQLNVVLGQELEAAWYELDVKTGEITYAYPALYFAPDRNEPNAIRHYPSQEWETCLRRVDLDEDDSSLPELDFEQPQLCQFEDIPVSDLDVEITSHRLLDSITFQILDHTPDQWLSGVAVNTDIRGSGTDHLVLTSLSDATTEDLQEAVTYVRYHQSPTAGIRTAQVAVLGWLDGIHGDTAYAYLHLPPSLPDAGPNSLVDYCVADSIIRLDSIRTGESGGVWYDDDGQRILPAQIDLTSADTIIATYIIAYSGCADTSTHVIVISDLPSLTGISDVTLCHSDSYQLNLEDLDNVSIQWSDGSTDLLRTISSAGDYAFTISNRAGCTQEYDFTVVYLPEPQLLTQEIQVCQGDRFSWRDRQLSLSGVYSDTLTSTSGCDSVIHRLDLDVLSPDPLDLAFPDLLCSENSDSIVILSDHQSVSINGVPADLITSITSAGEYLITAVDFQGCEVARTLVIDAASSPFVDVESSIDTVFVPGIEILPFYSGDVSQYLWSPSDSLSCETCPFPTLISQTEQSYTIIVANEAGCTAQASVSISFRPPSVYLANVVSSASDFLRNQVLYAQSNHDLPYELEVYSRWGNKIFHGRDLPMNDPTAGWHVTQDVQTGVYVYVVKIGPEIISGDVTVLH